MGADNIYVGNPCQHGHDGRRYKSNGQCVECQRLHNASRVRKGHPPKRGVQGNTYIGAPCKRGHSGRRYTINCACIECDKERGAAQREYFAAYQRVRRAKLKDDPEYKRLNCERMARYRREHPMHIDRLEQHRQAVQFNTINLLYYGDTAHTYTSGRRQTNELDDNY